MNTMNYTELKQKQLDLEAEMFNGGIKRFEANEARALKAGAASETMYNRKLIKELISPFAEGIQAYKDYYKGRRGSPSRALKYLNCVPNETAAYITLKMTLDLMNVEVTLPHIAMAIGERIEDQVRFTKLEGEAQKYFKKVQDALKKNSTASYQHKHRVMVAAEKKIVENDEKGEAERWVSWNKADLGLIGFQLLDIMESVLMYEGEPVFSRKVVRVDGGKKQKALLKVSDKIDAWIGEHRESLMALSPSYGPCIIRPRDWQTPFHGGFHTSEVAKRVNMVKGHRNHVKRLTKKQMPLVYEALNYLQHTEWQVNTGVLEVAEEVLRRDLGYAMENTAPIIDREHKPVCPVPDVYRDLKGKDLKAVLTEKEWAEFMEWKKACADLHTKERKRSSKSMATTRVLGQARKYAEYEKIYFVYTVDSRGRVYAKSMGLSPQGDDLCKSLLRSARGQYLSDEGYRQFCITGANLWGWDKDTEEDKFSKSNAVDFIEMCKDIKADALTFKDWVEADEPWEFLAWALEFAEYHELKEQGLEHTFRTHLPNGRDGSCSGIQHYSAMMHDEIGGAAVNLVPSPTHQDIYKRVADRVIEKLNDVLEGNYLDFGEKKPILDYIQSMLAGQWLDVGITRGMTKKPVMTLPYGSSQLTCMKSIEDYLKDLLDEEEKLAKVQGRAVNDVHPFGKGDSFKTAIRFMTKLVWTSITEVVKAPVVAMKFIKQLSNKVSALNEALEWTTPTGFIVHQEIYEMDTTIVKTKLMGMSKFSLLEESDTIDRYAMAGAAAPNFVHSYDASHLILTVVAMGRAGMGFIHVIHDDFGSYANNTADLQVILRTEMINMYKEFNRLQELLEENESRLNEDFELTVPPQYNLNLDVLLESRSAFA